MMFMKLSEDDDKIICEIRQGQVELEYDKDKPKEFDDGVALAVLLAKEVVFINDHWWLKDWPKEAQKTFSVNVNCNDVFAWGCAAAEEMFIGDIEEVYRYWEKDNDCGPAVWCMIKRREMPQAPAIKYIEKSGVFNVEELRVKHNLRPCWYDLMSKNLADAQYGKYAAWCAERGEAPLERNSVKWWTGWTEYAKAHPGWEKEDWYVGVRVATKAHWDSL
jgi:hypothetical protein